MLARFLDEARATAQLQHPGVVPVHDLGTLPDGRVWFTMKEVRGRTLTEVIADAHAPTAAAGAGRQLLTAFLAICQAVAYAHERGVVHRDLKPANTMVGAHGEVYVLDWGLAKIVGRGDRVGDLGPITSGRPADQATQMGQVAGTPAYMAPEQARGEVDRIDARSDVYALGGMLYEILSGRAPYSGGAREVVDAVVAGPPPPVAPRSPWDETAGDLVRACRRAMEREPADRFPDALALADEVRAWLDGTRRREQALEVTGRAAVARAEAERRASDAGRLRDEAAELLRGVASYEPEERKAPGWDRADAASAAALQARLHELDADETLRAALQVDPGLPEAHAELAQRYLARHRAAEAARDRRAVAEAGALLARHAPAFPEEHPLRAEIAAYLVGDGALTLVTDPPGAEVLLFRYVERNRRRVEVFERSLGTTPLCDVPLPMGSYLCVLEHPDRERVRYPVEIARCARWDGAPPGEVEPAPVWLPPRGWLADDEVYVPAGWFRSGGDPEVAGFARERVWCDALVLQRDPVTNARYVAWLDELVASGREEEALRHAPRQAPGQGGAEGALIFARHSDGRFRLGADADGDVWHPDHPVIHVDWASARAWLAWWGERRGRPFRLPGELEWEKCARGADGRWHPWGDFLDPSWCCMIDSHPGRRGLATVDAFPIDVSPYGVRGLAGNVMDWCLERFDSGPGIVGGRVVSPELEATPSPDDLRTTRGGTWSGNARNVRSANRYRYAASLRLPYIGFRGLFRPAVAG